MAKPIEATPDLYGQDAIDLLESLKNRASNEEITRRKMISKERFSKPYIFELKTR